MKWTNKSEEQVAAMLAEGLTRKVIAERMGVTRNAICGLAHRLSKRARSSDGSEQRISNPQVAGSTPAGHTTAPEIEDDYDFTWTPIGKWRDLTPPAPPPKPGPNPKITVAPIVMMLALPAPPKFLALPAPDWYRLIPSKLDWGVGPDLYEIEVITPARHPYRHRTLHLHEDDGEADFYLRRIATYSSIQFGGRFFVFRRGLIFKPGRYYAEYNDGYSRLEIGAADGDFHEIVYAYIPGRRKPTDPESFAEWISNGRKHETSDTQTSP